MTVARFRVYIGIVDESLARHLAVCVAAVKRSKRAHIQEKTPTFTVGFFAGQALRDRVPRAVILRDDAFLRRFESAALMPEF